MASQPARKEIDEDRAAVLLGLTLTQLRQLCEQSGMGPGAAREDSERRWFTYRDLYRLCCWVARPVG
jgi:hypothetical protein